MVNKITCFFALFGTVYFLESIGGFYMTSAVVYIEKQFQIPSKMSGTMVSAGDFAYIPVVVFTSYFGGKGNRARWIGGGCILIAIANLLIASSNFLFPVEKFDLDEAHVSQSLAYEVKSFDSNRTIGEFESFSRTVDTNPITDVISGANSTPKALFDSYRLFCFRHPKHDLCTDIETFFLSLGAVDARDVSSVRILTALPFAFCHPTVNGLRKEHKVEECAKNPSSMGPFLMIFGGLLVLGVGRTMPFSLGLPLMDDNVKRKNLPVFFAGMFFVKVLGPVVGLLVGSQLNKIYYTFEAPQGLTPVDPMWIGCWWLGFLIFGLLLFFPSLALALFPSSTLAEQEKDEGVEMEPLNADGKIKKKRTLNLVDKHVRKKSDGKAFYPETAKDKLHDFLSTMKSLLRTPIYIGALFGRIIDVLAFKGFYVFLGKYLELQFGVPQFVIQRYIAIVGVMGFAIGVGGGATAMKFLKLQGRKAAAWVAVCSLLAACLSFANATVGCKSVIGKIGDQAVANNFTFPVCRDYCQCDDVPLYPVCNSKGDVFYSPCHAGCPLAGANFTIFKKAEPGEKMSFAGCECAGTEDAIVSRDMCNNDDCESKFNWFFVNQAITALAGGLGVVPGMLIILRAVPAEHRSVSLGFNGFLVSLFATLPSPVFWGKIFDQSCLMWQTVCESTGACPIYDTDELRVRIHLIYGGLRIFSLLSDIWVFYFAKGLVLTDEEEKTEEEEEEEKEERTANGAEPETASS